MYESESFASVRGWLLPVIAVLALAVLGCGEDGTKQQSPGEVAAADELDSEQSSVLARRDALLKMRRQLGEKREALAEKRREIRASGGDISVLDEQASELRDREQELAQEEASLAAKIEALLEERRAMTQALAAGDDEAARMAARESGLAQRERALARRESDIARREATLAEREQALAAREENMCGGAPTTIVKTVQPEGSHYTRRDVDPLLKRARRRMSQKGLLRSDLPAPAQGLEREATRAMAKGNYGRARFAAAQLVDSVDSVRVDKGFIAAKIRRLNNAIRGVKLSAKKQARVDELFRDATAAYGDGEFAGANRKLNRIYAALK